MDFSRSASPKDGYRTSRGELDRSVSRGFERNSSRSTRMEELRSWRRSMSRSPTCSRGCTQRRSAEEEIELYRGSRRSGSGDDYDFDYHTRNKFSIGENRHNSRYDSVSPKSDVCHRGHSPKRNRRHHHRSLTPNRSRSPPTAVRDSRVVGSRQCLDLTSVKEKSISTTSSALGRRQRRHDQAVREEDMTSRQKNGKKPFYLTLDPEGKPYGPGKPAWVAQINKLAAGLDPSCTHIRKQTYEALQTLKDRLNEDFDYSGKLNEDHLRGMMGKAVTKRRGELISLIKSNGKQPVSIDYRVWRRLEKLAYSKQREEKSEQGRYANSCRKTLGRTGSRGTDGVRERLRHLLGRSPDPDEVEDELQRDKGYGGQKKKRRMDLIRRENEIEGFLQSDEGTASQTVGKYSDHSSSDSGSEQRRRRHSRNFREAVTESSGKDRDFVANNVRTSTERPSAIQQSCSGTRTSTVSRDDYIESLKAIIERLEAEKENGCTSNAGKSTQSAVCTPFSGSEGSKRH